MTIAEQIQRAKADYDAVFEAGKKSVLSVLDFTDVESTAYRNIVPTDAETFARVNKIGGMSYKTRNLIPFPYDKESHTQNGLTATANSDGSITLKGTATEVGRFTTYFIGNRKVFFPKGTTLSIAKMPNATYSKMRWRTSLAFGTVENTVAHFEAHANVTKTLTEDADRLQMDIDYWTESVGEVVDVTFYPMLNEGTTALPFEPFFEGLRSASVSELKSEGANLIPYPYYYQGETIRNGVTWNFSENGITASGTQDAGNSVILYSFSSPITLNGTYTVSLNKALPSGCTLYLTFDDGSGIVELLKNGKLAETTTINNRKCTSIRFWIVAGSTFNGESFLPMLNEGATALPYKQYKGNIDTFAIHEAIKNLDGYGLGINSEYYNYIDFERKVFVQNVYRKVFDGTENWIAGGTDAKLMKLTYTDTMPTGVNYMPCLSNTLKGTTTAPNSLNEGEFCVLASDIYIRKESVSNPNGNASGDEKISNFKTWLSANPITVIYVLAEPIETDISAYLTAEYIEVEGGGTVTAVNEYEYDVPTNISYLIDTQGVNYG